MRIDELTMRAYGSLGNHRLSLAGGGEGLHVVYGPNEAGKSLCLRAMEYALFGLPAHLSPLGFDPLLIRIGATLSRRRTTGEVERITYRRSRSRIYQSDDDTPFDANQLTDFLGDLTKETFQATYGLNSDRIRQGANELHAGGGDIGRAVFAASSGIDTLQHVADRLRREAAEIFLGRNNSSKILDRDIQALRAAHAEYQAAVTRPDTARATLEQLAAERQRLADLTATIDELRGRRSRLIRVQAGLAAARSIHRGRQILAETADLPPLPEDFTSRFSNADLAMQQASAALETARRETRKARAEFEEIAFDERYLAWHDEIESLFGLSGQIHSCLVDLPDKRTRAADLRRRIGDALREIGRPDATDAPLDAVLGGPARARLAALIEDHRALTQRVESAEENLAKQQLAVDAARRVLAEGSAATAVRPLAGRLQDLQSRRDLARRRVELTAKLSQARAKAAAARVRLSGLLSEVPPLEDRVVPSREEIREFGDRFAKLAQRIEASERALHEGETAVDARARLLQDLIAQADLPAADALSQQRQIRNDLLRDLRARVDDGSVVPSGTGTLMADLEAAASKADLLADTLLANAARVHQRSQAVIDHREATASLTRQREWLAALERQREALEEEWRSRWAELGVAAARPAAMQAWLDAHADLVDARTTEADLGAEIREIDEQSNRDLDALRALLGDLGISTADDADHTALLARAADAVSDLQERAGRRHEQEENLRKAEHLLAERAAARDLGLASLAAWRTQWRECMTAIRQAEDTAPALVRGMIDGMASITNQVNQLTILEDDVARMEALLKATEARVHAILSALGQAPEDRPLPAQIAGLNAVSDEQQRKFLAAAEARKRLEQRRDEETAADHLRDRSQAELTRLRELARAATNEAALEVARRVEDRRTAAATVRKNEEELVRLVPPDRLEAFIEECLRHDEEELHRLFDEIDRDEEQREPELEACTATVARLTEATAAYDSDRAARLMENYLDVQARVVRHVERYVPLRLAGHVLDNAIRRFRETSASPIVSRASGYFRRITGASFTGIGQGDNRIFGTRDAETAVPIERMSEGTRDQVYLAMRLAALCESPSDGHELMPLVIDDGLVNFDDDRTARILELLAETSSLTQVIIFTHHRHVVAAAETLQASSPDRVFIHEIEPVSAAAAV